MSSEVFRLFHPSRQDTSVIFASPHSGRDYPAAFLEQSQLESHILRSSEDAFVEELFAAAAELGAPLLAARVPRAYIDLNRAPDELDPALIEGVGKAPHNPRISSGLGVIPRVVSGGRQIYSGKLPMAEAEARLRAYWHPYHRTLRELIESTHQRFGQVILIDCHSMPHEAIAHHSRPGVPCPEVVLGDRFGASAGREVMEQVEAAFAGAGFRVARNAPFAGAFVSQSYGRPSTRRHVVQVEIDRSLYMDERQVMPLPGFADFGAVITKVIRDVVKIGRDGIEYHDRPLAAE